MLQSVRLLLFLQEIIIIWWSIIISPFTVSGLPKVLEKHEKIKEIQQEARGQEIRGKLYDGELFYMLFCFI